MYVAFLACDHQRLFQDSDLSGDELDELLCPICKIPRKVSYKYPTGNGEPGRIPAICTVKVWSGTNIQAIQRDISGWPWMFPTEADATKFAESQGMSHTIKGVFIKDIEKWVLIDNCSVLSLPTLR